jgi:hypothetical protein
VPGVVLGIIVGLCGMIFHAKAALLAVRTLLKLEVEPVPCEPAALAGLIERAYALTGTAADSVQQARAASEAAAQTSGCTPPGRPRP